MNELKIEKKLLKSLMNMFINNGSSMKQEIRDELWLEIRKVEDKIYEIEKKEFANNQK